MLIVLCWLLRVRPSRAVQRRPTSADPDSRVAPQPASAVDESSVSGLDRALNTLCDAFLFFDTNGVGWITKGNVEAALGGSGAASGSTRQGGSYRGGEANAHAPAHSPGLAGGTSNASMRRFSEMDFDHNGRVSFPEFVAALESWAGVEEDDA